VPARHILIVEDNEDARETLRLLLELEGHHVDAVDSGRAAVEQARAGHHDIGLVDIGLPDMDGYQVAHEIRAAGGNMYLIALTGYGQPDDRRRTTEAGFDNHLVKPVDPDQLVKLLTTVGT
jgi:CheY-like chemotaxis protein